MARTLAFTSIVAIAYLLIMVTVGDQSPIEDFESQMSHGLLGISDANIESIIIRSSEHAISFVRDGERWQFAPNVALSESVRSHLKDAIKILVKTEPVRILQAEEIVNRDDKDFGLDTPLLTLTVNFFDPTVGKNEQHSIRIGARSPSSDFYYAQVDERGPIYLMWTFYRSIWDELLQQTLAPLTEPKSN